MNNKFDELAKGLAQPVTRRAALKKFSAGLAGVMLGALGFANSAVAKRVDPACRKACNHCRYPYGCNPGDSSCFSYCNGCCYSV